jgi:hypothetical protein
MRTATASLVILVTCLASFAAPAIAETFTVRCAMSETERLSGKETAKREYTIEITVDLRAHRFHVFENAARKHYSGKVESIYQSDAGAIRLNKPLEIRHGTETVNDSGLRLDRRDLNLAGESVLKDGSMVLETTWSGACARIALKPLPTG